MAARARHRGPAPPAMDGSGFPLPCLLGFRSAILSDVFDEVSRYCENRNRVLPEREEYEGTLDGVPIGNDFLVPAVLVRDSVIRSKVDITFGTSSICWWIRPAVVGEPGAGAAEPGPRSARRPSPRLLHTRPVRFTAGRRQIRTISRRGAPRGLLQTRTQPPLGGHRPPRTQRACARNPSPASPHGSSRSAHGPQPAA